MVERFWVADVSTTRVTVPVARPCAALNVRNEKSAFAAKTQKKMELKARTAKPTCAMALSEVRMDKENGTGRGGGAKRSEESSMGLVYPGKAYACRVHRRPAMRRILFALAFLPALAFAAAPATLESRSVDHALIVDVIPIGLAAEYSVRVVDLHTGELMATAKFTDGSTGDSIAEFKGMRVHIHLQPTYNGIFASAQVEKDQMMLDSMDARWSLRPTGIGVNFPRTSRPPFTNALRVGGDVKAPVIR